MSITKDTRGLRDMVDAKKTFREQRKDLNVVGIAGLASYDQYGDEEHQKKYRDGRDFRDNLVNTVLVTHWKDKAHEPGHEPVFLTTLAVSEPLKILAKYDTR